MKKGLLLSVVASGLIYAGGDIAPVAPVQQQPAAAPAACDFYGSLGARYEFVKDSSKANSWGKKDNTWKTTLVLGVNKELGYGFGFGAEVAATTDFGLDIATKRTAENAELSQLFLTYKAGNTAIKAGRQALPKSLSPWAWSDRTVGRLDSSYEGVVVVNTDLPDTTLVGAWIARTVDNAAYKNYLNLPSNYTGPVNGKNDKGLLMLAAQYKGIANTTITGSVYYVFKPVKATSAWLSYETKISSVNLGLQAAYAKTKGSKATTGVAAYAGTTYGAFDAKLTVAYIKDGAIHLNLGGTSGFWGNVGYSNFGGDISGIANDKQKIAKLDLGYKLPNNYGKVYGGVAYDKHTGKAKDLAARVGYAFTVKGVNAKVEYRYTKNTDSDGANTKINKVRVEGIYKF